MHVIFESTLTTDGWQKPILCGRLSTLRQEVMFSYPIIAWILPLSDKIKKGEVKKKVKFKLYLTGLKRLKRTHRYVAASEKSFPVQMFTTLTVYTSMFVYISLTTYNLAMNKKHWRESHQFIYTGMSFFVYFCLLLMSQKYQNFPFTALIEKNA